MNPTALDLGRIAAPTYTRETIGPALARLGLRWFAVAESADLFTGTPVLIVSVRPEDAPKVRSRLIGNVLVDDTEVE